MCVYVRIHSRQEWTRPGEALKLGLTLDARNRALSNDVRARQRFRRGPHEVVQACIGVKKQHDVFLPRGDLSSRGVFCDIEQSPLRHESFAEACPPMPKTKAAPLMDLGINNFDNGTPALLGIDDFRSLLTKEGHAVASKVARQGGSSATMVITCLPKARIVVP